MSYQDDELRLEANQEVFTHDRTAHELDEEHWAERGIFGFNSRDMRSRSFNLLRSQIIKAATANGWRSIGVTSPTPRVGKSFIAANLSASLSRIPTIQTLLFDLDLRRGSVADVFHIDGNVGINSFLAGEIDSLDGASYGVGGTNLTIFPSFVTDNSSAELLAGSRMLNLVNSMHSLPENTLCICDLPPVFANDDAVIITRQVDAYLLVVEEGKTTARQVKDAMQLLRPAPCIGTVLNRYRGGFGADDYGFGYGRQAGYEAYYN